MFYVVRNTMTVNSPESPFSSVHALALHRSSLTTQQGVFQLLMRNDGVYSKSSASHDIDTCIGNYRVIALGDKSEQSGKYEWAVVSTPFKTSLFVIARNVEVLKM